MMNHPTRDGANAAGTTPSGTAIAVCHSVQPEQNQPPRRQARQGRQDNSNRLPWRTWRLGGSILPSGWCMSGVALAAATLLAYGSPAHAGTAEVQITAADVRVLPDLHPFFEAPITWFSGQATGQWVDGVSLVGSGEPNFLGSGEAANDLSAYLELGIDIANANPDGFGDGTLSHQLISPSTIDFTAMSGDTPTTFDNTITIDRVAPDSFAALRFFGFTFTGSDAAFFDLYPDDFPAEGVTFDGESIGFSLDFTGTEERDYSALLNLETDTPGLTIPFEITGRVTGGGPAVVPSPTAAAGGLMLGLIASRRRRREEQFQIK